MVQDKPGKTTSTLFHNQMEHLIGIPIEKAILEIVSHLLEIPTIRQRYQ